MYLKKNQQAVQGFQPNRSYTKGEADAKFSTAGLTQLASTETPNGVITVFTFSTATAKPSFLVVDNVFQKATSKAGTVNWTWSAGPKQATLTIAPVDDIYGIV